VFYLVNHSWPEGGALALDGRQGSTNPEGRRSALLRNMGRLITEEPHKCEWGPRHLRWCPKAARPVPRLPQNRCLYLASGKRTLRGVCEIHWPQSGAWSATWRKAVGAIAARYRQRGPARLYAQQSMAGSALAQSLGDAMRVWSRCAI